MWKPKLNNDYQPLPNGNLINKAVKIISKTYPFPKETLKDQHGRWGLRYGSFLLLAKDYVYGNIISCHREAIGLAIKNKIPIIIFIDNRFYKFNPEDILKNSEINHKGQAEMYNFNIKLGQRVMI